MRYKVARLAVAVACRLFSTTNGVDVIVTLDHVVAARDLLLRIYKSPKFGYYSESQVTNRKLQNSEENYLETKSWLVPQVDVCEFLREHLSRPFTPQMMRDNLGMQFTQVSNINSELKKRGLIQDSHGGNMYVSTRLLEKLLGDIPS